MRKTAYKPEIDGLRSIAILSVVFYHAGFFLDDKNIIPGGFLGVDIFFVISGYLITSIILRNVRNHTFSFIDFYERRARRILPILLFVMVVSIPFAWLFILPSQFVDFSYQIITGIFFSSNIYFSLEDSYWAAESALKPFLHTWSLGIEEQFYFLMPLVLIALYRLKSRLIYPLLFLTGISLIYSQWLSSELPQQSFYLLPSRAWELLVGVMIAVIHPWNKFTKYKLTQYFPSFGVFLIMLSFFWFDKETLHPSFLTLIPVIGAALIIYFSNSKDWSISLLSSKIFVGIGLISYGIYIWHFPIFSFHKIMSYESTFSIKIILILISIILSLISYFVIEKPFRNSSIIPTKIFFSIVLVLIFILTSFSYVGTQGNFKRGFPEIINQPEKPEKLENHKWFSTKGIKKNNIILVGDSHMNSIAPTLKKQALDNGYDFSNSGFGACQLLINANRVRKSDFKLHKKCHKDAQEKRINFILNSKSSYVAIGGRLPLILEEDRFNNQEGGDEGKMNDFIQNVNNSLTTQNERQEFIKRMYKKTVQRILSAGHWVVLIYPIPEVGWHVPKTLQKRIGNNISNAREILKNNPITTSHKVFRDRTKTSYKLLDSINHDRIIRIYPEKLFCNTEIRNRCLTHNLDSSFYIDDDHLSETGAKLLVDYLLLEIEATLDKAK